MQVCGSSCDMLAHTGSSIVNRMSHLSYLLPHCCHAHVWYQLSIDVQWASCACNWIVFAVFSGSKGMCNDQTRGMLCTGIFSRALKPFYMSRISTFAASILAFCKPIQDQSSSCIGFEAFVHHSSGVFAYAWLVFFFSFCAYDLVNLCTDDALG